MKKIHIPTKQELLLADKAYMGDEKRELIYSVAKFLIDKFWNNSQHVADGLAVLLLVWNSSFYRYSNFELDTKSLEKWLIKRKKELNKFRKKSINSFKETDGGLITKLFDELLDVLKIEKRKTPVGVAKALHLLAPDFFPLWDDRIARKYGCYWSSTNYAAEKYLEFMLRTKEVYSHVKKYKINLKKSLLKLIDEYNYSKYTKKWI